MSNYNLTGYTYLEGIKKLIAVFLFFCITLFSQEVVFGAGPKRINAGFETGTFAGWTGYTWMYRTSPYLDIPKAEGIFPGRHTIISDKNATDPNTGNQLKMIPRGYNYSAKLGTELVLNEHESNPARPGGQHQSLSYTTKIDSSNALFIWKFALVLEDPSSNHAYDEEPRFKISLYNEEGDTISDCSYYDVYAGDSNIKGFKTFTPSDTNATTVVWRDWTTVGANLTPFIGKTITIEFLSAGCTKRGHFGYGYFVLDMLPMYITVDYCKKSLDASLIAPEGFEIYQWQDSNGKVVGTNQILVVKDPKEGAKFTCSLTSATGCKVTLNTTILRYEPKADFTSTMVDCVSNEVKFNNSSTILNGKMEFLWDFGDGKTSTEEEPVYKFGKSGMHTVSLIVFNPPSGCTDTLIKTVESFSPPLIGIDGYQTYCPGEKTKLKAYGAYEYKWSTGEKADSVIIGSPGGDFWMEASSSTGCKAKVDVNIYEEPDWPFTVTDISVICKGENLKLEAKGAISYAWNTGILTSSILVSKKGTYDVTGINQRGCKKNVSVLITEDDLPKADFELSAYQVNNRHNTITGSIKQEDFVTYRWDMGDGALGSGNMYTHSYHLKPDDLEFEVTLISTNENGCINSSVKKVYVDIFIPNVFTPNQDGSNDIFMPDYFIQVFDRNGIILFSGTDGWDGNYKGKPLDADTYFYVLEYVNSMKGKYIKQGYITLVR